MDPEMSGDVLHVSESPQREEAVMEKEVVSKVETPEESMEPEKPPAAVEDPEQLAVNGHDTEELIVTENVTLSDEKTENEIEESLPEEKPEPESVPCVVAKPDESSETDPVGDLDTEPVPENKPESKQTPLAECVPVPEPDDLPKSLPEAELPEQTFDEPAKLPQQVDAPPLDQEEKEAEEVVTVMDTKVEEVVKVEVMEPKKEDEKPSETAVSSEEPAEVLTLKETTPEKVAETVTPAEDQKKEDELEKSGEAEPAEPEKEEDTVPAPGSLSFALLEQEQTKDALRNSRTLIILRGLPGSGKSFLASAIADAYKDHCSVICADNHGITPENPGSSADGYKALDEAVVACCSASSVLIVVDDTNHTQDRLARLGEIAEEHHLVAVFLEPRTEWSRDLAQLTPKTKRGLEEVQMKSMSEELEEVSLPLYFGWFLLSSVQEKVRCTSMDFLKTLDTLEAFKKNSNDFSGKAEKEVDLEQYFQAKGTLHCTTKFCNYGKAEGAQEYAQKPAVRDLYGSAFELSLSALFVTPRTFGARVALTEEQLKLWPADAEKEAESVVPAAASLPLGSRAHVTLGCAEGVEPVQTGLDLLEILALQQAGQQGEPVEEMELGTLTYYSEGRWLLSLREPITAPACFSSFYGRKEPGLTKREPEKKKKPKCTIL
ncbi:2',3'-cyclic-nucleotide 3'-phosphodiesterase [Aulostomus maculatus]